MRAAPTCLTLLLALAIPMCVLSNPPQDAGEALARAAVTAALENRAYPRLDSVPVASCSVHAALAADSITDGGLLRAMRVTGAVSTASACEAHDLGIAIDGRYLRLDSVRVHRPDSASVYFMAETGDAVFFETYTLTRPAGSDSLPPTGLRRWHVQQVVINRFMHISPTRR